MSGQRVPLTASSWGHRHTGPPLLPGCVPCTSNPLISPSRGPLQGALGCRGPGTPEESGFTWPPARPKPGPVGLGRLGHDRSRASQPNQRLDRRTDRHRPPRQAPPLYFLPCFICLDCPQVQGWGEVHFCPFQISVHQKHPKPRGGDMTHLPLPLVAVSGPRGQPGESSGSCGRLNKGTFCSRTGLAVSKQWALWAVGSSRVPWEQAGVGWGRALSYGPRHVGGRRGSILPL